MEAENSPEASVPMYQSTRIQPRRLESVLRTV